MPIQTLDYFSTGSFSGSDRIVVHKIGKNSSVGTSYVPISIGGVYNTPQPASATTLRVKAGGNANDTAAGSGAREITLEGLDATGALITDTLATAGASASAVSTKSFIRLLRAHVSSSGTYATVTSGSHSADITIENGAGGTDWATISSTGFPVSQTEIGAYTVPLGYDAYVKGIQVFTDATKTVDILFFKRESILSADAPYQALRLQYEFQVTDGGAIINFHAPVRFPELTDIGFLAKVDSGTALVTVEFQLMLVPNS